MLTQTKTIGIAMNGITGRIGQKHLAAISAIQKKGGLLLAGGQRIYPEPILLGRDQTKLELLGQEFGFRQQSTNLAAALADQNTSIYFDALVPLERPANIQQALLAGKHVYAEKPLATTYKAAHELSQLAQNLGLRHGLVQNLLFQPGPQKLEQLVRNGFFGRILNARIDFGYWVFEGDWQAAQRPAWNYQSESGGGISVDMFPHWNGLLENLFGPVRAISHLAKTHIPERFDQQQPYRATADDAAYSLLELESGITVQISASWTTRVYHDDFLSIQIDGTHGSAVASYRTCKVQHRVQTPRSSAMISAFPPQADWQELPELLKVSEPFQAQWEYFLRAVGNNQPFPWDFFAAARGLQLAETALQSNLERRWLTINPNGEASHV